MEIARIGLDLAKYVFEIHGVDAHGKTVVRKTLRRHAVSAFFANLPPCLVGLEASNGAHFWEGAFRPRSRCPIDQSTVRHALCEVQQERSE
jgi:transposase